MAQIELPQKTQNYPTTSPAQHPNTPRPGGCMKTVSRRFGRLAGGAARVLAATACFAVAAPLNAFAANIVVEWNATAVSTALAAGQGSVPQTRSMAIVAVAVNDAVNAVSRRYA